MPLLGLYASKAEILALFNACDPDTEGFITIWDLRRLLTRGGGVATVKADRRTGDSGAISLS